MIIAGLGLIFSIVAAFVRIKNENGSVQGALNFGNWLSIVLTFIVLFNRVLNSISRNINSWRLFSKSGVFWAVPPVWLLVG